MPSVRAATDASTLPIAPRGDSGATGEARADRGADFSTALAAVHAHGTTHHAPERHDDAHPSAAASRDDARGDEDGASDTPSANAAQTSTTAAPAAAHAARGGAPTDAVAPTSGSASRRHGHRSVDVATFPAAATAATLPAGDGSHAQRAVAGARSTTADQVAVATDVTLEQGTSAEPASGRGAAGTAATVPTSTAPRLAASAASEVATSPSRAASLDSVAASPTGDPPQSDGASDGGDERVADETHTEHRDGSASVPRGATIGTEPASTTATNAGERGSAAAASVDAESPAAPRAEQNTVVENGAMTTAAADRASAPTNDGGASAEADAAASGGAGLATDAAIDATGDQGGDVDPPAPVRAAPDTPSQITTKPQRATATESRAVGQSTVVLHTAGANGDARLRREAVSVQRHVGAGTAREHAATPVGSASDGKGYDDATAGAAGQAERGRSARVAEAGREQRIDGPAATAARDGEISPGRPAVSTVPELTATADRERVATDADVGARTTGVATSARDATGTLGTTTDGTATPRRAADAGISPWAERVVESVRVATLRGGGEMRLRLEPAGLGHIDVRITLAHDGIRAAIVAEHDTTRALLRSEQHLLHAALERSDLRLAGFSVDLGFGASTGTFAEMREGAMARRDVAPPADGDGAVEQVAPVAIHAPATPGHLSVRV